MPMDRTLIFLLPWLLTFQDIPRAGLTRAPERNLGHDPMINAVNYMRSCTMYYTSVLIRAGCLQTLRMPHGFTASMPHGFTASIPSRSIETADGKNRSAMILPVLASAWPICSLGDAWTRPTLGKSSLHATPTAAAFHTEIL